MKKIINKLLITIGIIGVFFVGSIAGIKYNEYLYNQQEENKVDVNTIAIVNMDQGIINDGELINYASQLISIPDDRFISTGLNDAKNGVENGKYAGYIMIPENFLLSVTSLETNQQKAVLQYKLNSNLTHEAELKASSDINQFATKLNSNVSYMYIDGIMSQYHKIQDESVIIMQNDNAELVKLESIDVNNLIVVPEAVAETIVEDDVEPIDLDAFLLENEEILDKLYLEYAQASENGKDAFAKICETKVDVTTASSKFFSDYKTVINATATNQATLLDIGENNLKTALGIHNDKVSDKTEYMKEKIGYIVEEQRKADELSAQSQLDTILNNRDDDMEMSLERLQELWEETLSKTKSFAESEVKTIDDELRTYYQEQIDSQIDSIIEDAYLQGAKDALSSIEYNLAYYEDEEEATPGDAVKQVDGEIDITTVGDITEQDKLYSYDEIQRVHKEYLLTEVCEDQTLYSETALRIILKESLDNNYIQWSNAEITIPSPENMYDEEMGEEDGETDEINKESETINLEICKIASEENILNTATDFSTLFLLGEDKNQIANIIQRDFKDSLLTESNTQMEILDDSMDNLNGKIKAYEDKIINFDPYYYIKSENMDTYLNDIEANTMDMTGAVQSNNADYISYAMDVCSSNTETTNAIRTELSEANETTVANIEGCIGELIDSRQETNSYNVEKLERFTQSLQYTREGKQADVQVYDYIVSPVITHNLDYIIQEKEGEKELDNSMHVVVMSLFVLGILLCIVLICSVMVTYMLGKNKKYDNSI
ncbi:MAG: hypothetical protein E7263_04090 [Lachnospiraceae bacterium]|nr:hypothetical protein [Lachnospiraceae bacterium]